MAQPLRIGLTGGIASGKSTVEQRFVELGVAVINADDASRAVVAAGQPGLAAVAERFGNHVLTATGELDRRALRTIVFADERKRRELEAILHPLIRADMERRAAQAAGPYQVLSIPLLIEGQSEGKARDRGAARVDRILVIDVDETAQLQRLMSRDSINVDEARAIIASQASRADRLRAADDVLENSGTVPELRQAVDRLHAEYLRIAAALRP
jgi:dephospho-CoA kinase